MAQPEPIDPVIENNHPVEDDPYVLHPEKIQDPPKGWGPSMRFLGPGMITSAAVVGSGELITATTLGSRVGMMLLWLVFVSTFVKVAVQIELARWSISTGKPGIFGYDHVPPKIGGRSWASYIVILMFFQFMASQAGVVGSAALATSMLFPIGGDPLSPLSMGIYVWIYIVIAIAIHQLNRYSLIEMISTVLVVVVTLLVVLMVFGIQFTEFAWSGAELADGMRFQIAAGSMGVALSMFGLTGVGAGEISGYTFWCVEKGYAKTILANVPGLARQTSASLAVFGVYKDQPIFGGAPCCAPLLMDCAAVPRCWRPLWRSHFAPVILAGRERHLSDGGRDRHAGFHLVVHRDRQRGSRTATLFTSSTLLELSGIVLIAVGAIGLYDIVF